MSLSLFLLSEAFVTVIVDRNETKSNLSKKQEVKLTTIKQVKQTKKHVKSTELN